MEEKMKVFTATFNGHYLPGNAIVVSQTKRKAFNKLKKELEAQVIGKDLKLDDLTEIDISKGQCIILNDGNY